MRAQRWRAVARAVVGSVAFGVLLSACVFFGTDEGQPSKSGPLAWLQEGRLTIGYYLSCAYPADERRFVTFWFDYENQTVWRVRAEDGANAVAEFVVGEVPDGFDETTRNDELMDLVTSPDFDGILGVEVTTAAGSEFSGSVNLADLEHTNSRRVIWIGQLMGREDTECPD